MEGGALVLCYLTGRRVRLVVGLEGCLIDWEWRDEQGGEEGMYEYWIYWL
jgi:hypothetical protein